MRVFRPIKLFGQIGAQKVRNLGRGPDREEAARRVQLGDGAAALHGHAGLAMGAVGPAYDVGRLGLGRIQIAARHPAFDEEVSRPVVMKRRRSRRQRCLDIRQHGQGFVIDQDALRRILDLVRVVSQDRGHRFAHETHPPLGQKRLVGGLGLRIVLYRAYAQIADIHASEEQSVRKIA